MISDKEMQEFQALMALEKEEDDEGEWVENDDLPEWPQEAVEWQKEPKTLKPDEERVSRILAEYTNTMDAINKLADRLRDLRHERHQAMLRGLVPFLVSYREGDDEWAKEMRACERALDLLWDRRRSEISWEDDLARTTTPKGYRRAPESATSVYQSIAPAGSHGRLLLPLSQLRKV